MSDTQQPIDIKHQLMALLAERISAKYVESPPKLHYGAFSRAAREWDIDPRILYRLSRREAVHLSFETLLEIGARLGVRVVFVTD